MLSEHEISIRLLLDRGDIQPTTDMQKAPWRLLRYIEARVPFGGGTLRSGGACSVG